MQLSADFILTWMRELDARVTALEKPTNTARLPTADIIKIIFGLMVFAATIIGKITWPEAFALIKSALPK